MSTRIVAIRIGYHLGAVAMVAAGSLSAQVGHDPAGSPYRDLKFGQFLTVTGGKAFGKGGEAGLGPHNGTIVFARHDFLADRPVSLSLGGGWSKLERTYPIVGATTLQLKGPIDNTVYYAEGVAQLNVTGGKTWHNLAPFLNVGLGVTLAQKLPEDSSGFKFGTKFYIAPGAGFRYFVGRRLFVKVEGRAMYWSLTYPTRILADPDGTGPQTRLITGGSKEWTLTPVLTAGLGFAFHRPFF